MSDFIGQVFKAFANYDILPKNYRFAKCAYCSLRSIVAGIRRGVESHAMDAIS